ncbi:hypothetical protein Taro_005722 [Colocasia esculenta]|uniref:Uncharacterized protein n=1 Tax=Colocasia esculenta TaxID=4460 RepID=A0A843TYM9_COLES|nr:hypothetical protein [Colocasia esculenta]
MAKDDLSAQTEPTWCPACSRALRSGPHVTNRQISPSPPRLGAPHRRCPIAERARPLPSPSAPSSSPERPIVIALSPSAPSPSSSAPSSSPECPVIVAEHPVVVSSRHHRPFVGCPIVVAPLADDAAIFPPYLSFSPRASFWKSESRDMLPSLKKMQVHTLLRGTTLSLLPRFLPSEEEEAGCPVAYTELFCRAHKHKESGEFVFERVKEVVVSGQPKKGRMFGFGVGMDVGGVINSTMESGQLDSWFGRTVVPALHAMGVAFPHPPPLPPPFTAGFGQVVGEQVSSDADGDNLETHLADDYESHHLTFPILFLHYLCKHFCDMLKNI